MATDEQRQAPPKGRTATDQRPTNAAPPAAVPLPRSGRHAARSFSSADLFGSGTEIEIAHQGAIYLLKITRQGKLILNK